jgi:hypothetical protein
MQHHTLYYKLPLIQTKTTGFDDENDFIRKYNKINILDAIVQFVKLITITESGNYKADHSFGFKLLNYEFESDLMYRLNTDLQSIIQNKTSTLKYIASQIENILFNYFPESRQFVERVEVTIEAQTNPENMLYQKIDVVIHFIVPHFVHRLPQEEYKISLNIFRTIE